MWAMDGDRPKFMAAGKPIEPVFDLRRALAVGAAAFCLYYAWLYLAVIKNPLFLDVYVLAAQRMCRGECIHVFQENAYAYPPLMAFLVTPLASLPRGAAMGVWWAVNMAATVVVLVACWRLAGGGSLARVSRRWLIALALGSVISLRFFIAPLGTQQFDMVIAALLFSGCWLMLCGSELRGAALIGAAAAMKCTPLLFVPYLAWRRKFAAAALVAFAAVGLNLLPDLVFPRTSGRLYVQEWVDTFVRPAATAAPGSWIVDVTQNQSLGGMLRRLSEFGLPLREPEVGTAWTPSTGASWLRAANLGCAAFLLGTTFWCIGFPFRPWAVPSARIPSEPIPLQQLRFSFECAAIVCLMLLLSPMSSKAHYVVLLLPSLLFARVFVERWPSPSRWWMAAVVLFGPAVSKGLFRDAVNLALWWSLPVWFALTLLACVCLAMREIDRSVGRKESAARSTAKSRLAAAARKE